ncbi:hypothetical protein [Clostridium sp.]|uniref:hypothetical protein n=1 Tax=Clostridium sp. TaxID=1506 RepID=UPI0026183DA9|nr:hypothetical protein [Clostridium sp.]
MTYEIDQQMRDKVKKMLRHGSTYNQISEETALKQKEIKRIQRTDINPYFK